MKLDLTPIHHFSYNENFNHRFKLALLTPEGKILHTPAQCKDYFQDIFCSEYTNRDMSIYGIHWKPKMLDISTDYFYMGLFGGDVALKESLPNIVALLNEFEKVLGIEFSEGIETDNPENIVIKFHKGWTENGPIVSSMTTIMRLGAKYTPGEDVIEYLKKLKKKKISIFSYMRVEVARLEITLKRLAALLQGKKPDFPWENVVTVAYAHAYGIMEYPKFPQVEV